MGIRKGGEKKGLLRGGAFLVTENHFFLPGGERSFLIRKGDLSEKVRAARNNIRKGGEFTHQYLGGKKR